MPEKIRKVRRNPYFPAEIPWTAAPNIFWDELVYDMKLAENRVTHVLIRQYYGWHKTEVEASLTYLEKKTRLSRHSCIEGLRDGIERGTIIRLLVDVEGNIVEDDGSPEMAELEPAVGKHGGYLYRLNVSAPFEDNPEGSANFAPDEMTDDGSANFAPGGSAKNAPQASANSAPIKRKNPLNKLVKQTTDSVPPVGGTARALVGDPEAEGSPFASSHSGKSDGAGEQGGARKEGKRESKKDIPAAPVDAEVTAMLDCWRALFPKKRQPKPATHAAKIKARLKDAEFAAHWREAMEKAAGSASLQKEVWFQFEFFVRNDLNWQRLLNEEFKWKDEQMQRDAERVAKPANGKPQPPTVIDAGDSVDWNLRRLQRLQQQQRAGATA